MDIANTKPNVSTFDIEYVGGTKTGISVTLKHRTHPDMKALEVKQAKETLKSRDANSTVDDFIMLAEMQRQERRFVSIESWDWGIHTYKDKKPELTNDFVTSVCNNLDWFRAEIDKHLGNEVAFHPKWESA